MSNSDQADKVRQLEEENRKLRSALDEVRRAIDPFLERKSPSAPRSAEQQLLHDVRNVLNELGLLRALVPTDEESDK